MATDTEQAAAYAELRTTMAGLSDTVDRMRRDLAPLSALPHQLQAVTELHAERLANIRERIDTDARVLRAELAEVRQDLDTVTSWQTWAMRLVVGAVITAVVALVLAPRALG